MQPRRSVVLAWMFQVLPALIIWHLWKARNGFNYDGVRPSLQFTCSSICTDLRQLAHIRFPALDLQRMGWLEFVSRGEMVKVRLKGMPVYWDKPRLQEYKLNTDGSLLQNGCGGGGGVLRDRNGRMIFAFTEAYSEVSVLAAEMRALITGLQMCTDRGLNSVQIEVDSKLLVQMFKKEMSVPIKLRCLVRRLWQLGGQLSIQHCFRQGNSVADALAAMGSAGVSAKFLSFDLLPRHIRGFCNMDRFCIPSFRFRKVSVAGGACLNSFED